VDARNLESSLVFGFRLHFNARLASAPRQVIDLDDCEVAADIISSRIVASTLLNYDKF